MLKELLLNTSKAKKLYEYAKGFPIIDYHNHLSIDDIRENRRFTDIYDLWINPDPYKHRAMRMCGVSEVYITGSANNAMPIAVIRRLEIGFFICFPAFYIEKRGPKPSFN